MSVLFSQFWQKKNCQKNWKSQFFWKYRYRLSPTERFLPFDLRTKIGSLKNYKKNLLWFPHQRLLPLHFSDFIWLEGMEGIIKFHLRPHLLKSNKVIDRKYLEKSDVKKDLFFVKSWQYWKKLKFFLNEKLKW